jgi:hypothetical protein
MTEWGDGDMMTESCIDEAVILRKDRLRMLSRSLRVLFMDFERTDLDPETRVEDAREKINEARNDLSALRGKYPLARYPKGRYKKVHELLDALEVSCKKAEERMERFKNIRLRKKEVSSF